MLKGFRDNAPCCQFKLSIMARSCSPESYTHYRDPAWHISITNQWPSVVFQRPHLFHRCISYVKTGLKQRLVSRLQESSIIHSKPAKEALPKPTRSFEKEFRNLPRVMLMLTSVFSTMRVNSSKLILPSLSISASMMVLSTICCSC